MAAIVHHFSFALCVAQNVQKKQHILASKMYFIYSKDDIKYYS